MDDRSGYGDAEAKQILARATEIERDQGQRLDARSLREIGMEAGIAPSAIESAIAEHESAAPANVSWVRRRSPTIISVVIIVAVLVYVFLRRAAPLAQ